MTGIRGIRTVSWTAIGLLLFLLAVGYPTPSHDQELSTAWSERRFQNLSAEQGLPNGRVWGITQDQGGVSRLDPLPKPFKTYSLHPGPAQGQDIHAVYADRDGVLWLGLYGAGLLKRDRNTGAVRQYTTDRNNPASRSHNAVTVLHEDQSGSLWVSTSGGGLNGGGRSGRQAQNHLPASPGRLSSHTKGWALTIQKDGP